MTEAGNHRITYSSTINARERISFAPFFLFFLSPFIHVQDTVVVCIVTFTDAASELFISIAYEFFARREKPRY